MEQPNWQGGNKNGWVQSEVEEVVLGHEGCIELAEADSGLIEK